MASGIACIRFDRTEQKLHLFLPCTVTVAMADTCNLFLVVFVRLQCMCVCLW